MLNINIIKRAKITVLLSLLFISYPVIVTAQIQEGDTLQFWSVSYIDWQPDTTINQRLITAVCKKTGINCYVFTDVTLTSTPSQQIINNMASVFDTSYSTRLPQIYGPIPDEFDNDPRVFILIVESEIGWTGYFDPANQMPDTMVYRIWQKHSTEREILYISRSAFSYNTYLSNMAHEFGHLIHWGQDHTPEPLINPVKYWEDSWIDEAFATFAVVFLTENLAIPNIYDPNAFFAFNTDIPLIYFNTGLSYNQVKLWLVFMFEHYGGLNFISELISEQANGIQGVVNALGNLQYNESFDDMFEHWIIANYLDDEQYMNGKYGYNHYNFPACRFTKSHNSYPVLQQKDSVTSYAADYINFSTSVSRPLSISVNCDTASEFRLTFILLNTQNPNQINMINIPVDSTGSAIFNANSFGSLYNKIIMAVINTDPALNDSSSSHYTYNAIPANNISPVVTNEVYFFRLEQNYPNPFNPTTKIKFSIPRLSLANDVTSERAPKNVSLKIYNILGKEIASLISANTNGQEMLSSGTYEVEWNGINYPSGIYFCKLIYGNFSDIKKMVLLK